MTHLVIGTGEIGSALMKVFNCEGLDKDPIRFRIVPQETHYDILHIAIPYSEEFVDIVAEYKAKFTPKYTVVHSTVKPGTCRRINATHSPVIGIHPHLEEGIRTFTKFIGGPDASYVADEFRRAGLKVYLFDKSETTEIMKILDTTFYGVCIEYTKDVKRQCLEHDIPFEAWNIWTNNYNDGYVKLGHSEYTRPNLVPIMTEIKGHCVRPNLELFETKFTNFLKNE